MVFRIYSNKTYFPSAKGAQYSVRMVHELAEYKVTVVEWRIANKLYTFLSTAAALTVQKSRKNVTLGFSAVVYNKLTKRCQLYLSDGNVARPSIASKILEEFDDCSARIFMEQGKMERLLDPRFCS